MKTYIGIDNGTSGSIGIIASEHTHYQEMPTFKARSYTVKEKHISRVDVLKLMQVIKTYTGNSEKVAILERPMVNPGRFTATISAVRALEATLIVLEQLRIPVVYVDSKKWQKMFLPPQPEDKKLRKKGTERTKEIKEQSRVKGCEFFPGEVFPISQQGDADGLLIALWGKEQGL